MCAMYKYIHVYTRGLRYFQSIVPRTPSLSRFVLSNGAFHHIQHASVNFLENSSLMLGGDRPCLPALMRFKFFMNFFLGKLIN